MILQRLNCIIATSAGKTSDSPIVKRGKERNGLSRGKIIEYVDALFVLYDISLYIHLHVIAVFRILKC